MHTCTKSGLKIIALSSAGYIYKTFSFPNITEDLFPSIVISQSVQSLSCVRLFVTPLIAARQASLPITNSRSLLKLEFKQAPGVGDGEGSLTCCSPCDLKVLDTTV